MRWFTTLALTFLTSFMSPISLAEQANPVKADKYEGITITVNINTGTVEELSTLLVGIGEKKAKLIIDYRTENGPFKKIEDLMLVKGVGPALIEKNRDRILL